MGGHRKPDLGLCPGLSQQAWLASSLAQGKPSSLTGLAFRPRQRGAFSLASLFCCPRALLSAWQKLIPLCCWEALSWPTELGLACKVLAYLALASTPSVSGSGFPSLGFT
jgi:hypothetical protein